MKPSDDLIVSSTEPTGLNRKKVWMQKGKNLFNKNKKFLNAWINGKGNIASYENQNVVSELIPCKPNTKYTVSGYPENAFVKVASYNKNRKYINVLIDIQSSETKQTFTTGDNDYFIRVGCGDSLTVIDTIQLEQGSTATEYEEYIEPKIYIRNDNNVYEEFIGKEEALHESVFEASLPDVETNTNVSFIEMFPGLNLDDVICFNIEIIDVYSTWDRTYAHILKKTGVLQVRSYAEKQSVAVRVTAFYK